ncbi:hypothetical protein PBY51_020123 [Eleginops maclovinus]|uniref:Uncharacterized protein n=1 Tax=Eleginops maclovinus TaxID=56733 RepID=A0AAN8AMY3_ELEMC|nr:hypothetical protein PBY51_020123 [Eleginops maclovinus]
MAKCSDGISSANTRSFQKTQGRKKCKVCRSTKTQLHHPQMFKPPPAGKSDSIGTHQTDVGCRCGRCPQVHGETAESFPGEISSW